MNPSSRQLHRELENAQAAHRAALAENEMFHQLLDVAGPVREFVRAYVMLAEASVPLKSKAYDAPRGPRVGSDGPPPHMSTSRYRGVKERLDRTLSVLTRAAQDAFDEPDRAVRVEVCLRCGCEGDHRHRHLAVRAAESFLRQVLGDGAVPVVRVMGLAGLYGHSERTVQRAASQLGVFRSDGRWSLTGEEVR